MSEVQNMWGGYQSDQDDSLKVTGANTKFGLNQGVKLTRFEYSTLTGSGGSEGNPALLIEFDINGSSKNTRIYDPTVPGGRVYYRGVQQMDPNSEDYKAGLTEAVKQAKANITHYVKASGKTEEQIKAAFSVGINSFADLVKAASNLLTDTINKKSPLDLFLQYQPKISGNADRTYTDIPGNLAYGSYLTEHMKPVGEWKEERVWEEKDEAGNVLSKTGLRYVDNEGNVHRFQKDETFMKAKVSSEQTKADVAQVSGMNTTSVTNAAQAAW